MLARVRCPVPGSGLRSWVIRVGGPQRRPGYGASSRLARASIGCFPHCGSSAANIAADDPRSRLNGLAEGSLFHFAVAERRPPLASPRLDPRSRWRAGVKAGRKRLTGRLCRS